MLIRIVIGEEEGRHRLHKVKSVIKSAKWNMYAELWNKAENELDKAVQLAVSLRNKPIIDEILILLAKCREREKPEIE